MYKHKNGINFRKIEQDDLRPLLDLKNESWWGTHTVLFSNMQDQQRWFDNLGSIVLIAEEGESRVGVCVISDWDHISRRAGISGSIFKEHRKADVPKRAFEAGVDMAFEMFNLNRLDAEVLETNYSAQLLEIKILGFQIEGKRRMAVYKAGRYYDSLVLGLLRKEWEEQDRVKAMAGGCNQVFDHIKAGKLVERSKVNIQGG